MFTKIWIIQIGNELTSDICRGTVISEGKGETSWLPWPDNENMWNVTYSK